jgi:son of sevenless-like protein
MDDQQFVTNTFFCRAKYEYRSADVATPSLSFRRGDIIEVLNRLETGWWDGLLGEQRGWFPSNYVEVISDEEADVGYAALELQHRQQQQQPNLHLLPTYPTTSTIQSSTSPSSIVRPQSYNDHPNWPDPDTDSSTRNSRGVDELLTTNGEGESPHSDFWVPRVTQDGQVSFCFSPVSYTPFLLLVDLLCQHSDWPALSRPPHRHR